jgi:hypothetical protein
MGRAIRSNPRVAWLVCAFIACVWLDQGPSAKAYDALASEVAAGGRPWLAAWQPLAFAYRRAQGEELYFAAANAVRGLPFDSDVLLRDRGVALPAFRRFPEADGRWHAPYGEVPLEYPALLLPFIALPAALTSSFDAFAKVFGALMGAIVLGSVALALGAKRDLPGDERAARLWFAALLFLAQGGLLIQRLDAVPACLLAVALWAAARRRPLAMGLAVGLAGAAKVLPLVVLAPMMAVDASDWRGRGRAGAASVAACLGGAAAGVGLGLVAPMLAISPSGFADFLAYHGSRGLQIESTYGTLLSVVDLLIGQPSAATLSFGSFNLDTPAAATFAKLATPVVAVSILALTAWLAKAPAASEDDRVDRLALAALAALSCAWLGGKVFSPQYTTWAIPFVVALGPRRWRGVGVSLLVAMALAQLYLRGFYDYVCEMRPLGVVTLVARLGALGAMTGFVLAGLGRARTRPKVGPRGGATGNFPHAPRRTPPQAERRPAHRSPLPARLRPE